MLTSTVSKIVYDIRGITVPIASGYEIPFQIFSASDVSVTIGQSDGTVAELESGWSIQIPSGNGTNKVVFDSSYRFPADAESLAIARSIAVTQETDLRNGDKMDAEIIEAALDKLTAIAQQFREVLSRTFQLPITESPTDISFPGAAERASKIIGFDETGKKVTMWSNPNDAIHQIENIVEQINSLKDEIEEFRDDAQTAADDAEKAKADAQGMLDEAIESIESAKDYMDAAMMAGFEAVLGDGTATEFIIKHNLQTRRLLTQIWDNTDAGIPVWYISIIDDNNIKVSFESAPPAESLTLYISAIYSRTLTDMKISWGNVTDVAIRPDQVSDDFFMTADEMLGMLNQPSVG